MTIEDFHRSRRMFCIRSGKLLIAPSNCPNSHLQWLNCIGMDGLAIIQHSVRGFADDRGLFFYTGEDLHTDEKTEEELLKHIKQLKEAMKLPPNMPVYAGVIKTKDARYPPKKKLGTIAELTK
jgi:hypothetical protein